MPPTQDKRRRAHTAAPQKHRPGQFLATIIGNLGFQLDKANATAPEEVNSLYIDLAELVGRCMKGMVLVALGGE